MKAENLKGKRKQSNRKSGEGVPPLIFSENQAPKSRIIRGVP